MNFNSIAETNKPKPYLPSVQETQAPLYSLAVVAVCTHVFVEISLVHTRHFSCCLHLTLCAHIPDPDFNPHGLREAAESSQVRGAAHMRVLCKWYSPPVTLCGFKRFISLVILNPF